MAAPTPPGSTLGDEAALQPTLDDLELGADPRGLPPAVEMVEQARLHERLGLSEGPARIARFEVLERLGEGGMGVVLAAYDADLDRKVALKLLAERRVSRDAHARLVREARSLAKLSHPHIVHVYEVGEFEGQPYLAMELVSGSTLRDWLSRREPNRLAVLELFLAIGEGLAAAHEAGVVHRDFKPENVLVGEDGRPRIVDFGLALLDWSREANTRAADGGEPEDASLTCTGALMGTPAYMASEQWLGESTDARSDQYAFCVALYEALYGHRPFEASTLAELRERVLEDEPEPVEAAERVPAQLHAAILRGLSRDPDQRWPGLPPLLDCLRQAIATAQPGIFTNSPLRVIRLVAPLMLSLPLLWAGLELAGLVEYTARSWAWVSGLQLLLMGVAVVVLRERLLREMNERRMIVMPMIFIPLLLAHRALALATDTAVELMFAYDFLVLAAAGSAVALMVERGMWPMILVGLSLALTAALRPDWAGHLWLVFTLVAPLVIGLAATRAMRRRTHHDPLHRSSGTLGSS